MANSSFDCFCLLLAGAAKRLRHGLCRWPDSCVRLLVILVLSQPTLLIQKGKQRGILFCPVEHTVVFMWSTSWAFDNLLLCVHPRQCAPESAEKTGHGVHTSEIISTSILFISIPTAPEQKRWVQRQLLQLSCSSSWYAGRSCCSLSERKRLFTLGGQQKYLLMPA